MHYLRCLWLRNGGGLALLLEHCDGNLPDVSKKDGELLLCVTSVADTVSSVKARPSNLVTVHGCRWGTVLIIYSLHF